MIRNLIVCTLLALSSLPAAAVELSLPGGARQLADRPSTSHTYALPIAPFGDGAVPTRIFEGRIDRQSWRIDGATVTTLQLLKPLRDQIEAAGFKPVFECESQTCGGFDFRFDIEVIPAPDMHVDIRNYRFISAVRDGTEALSLLVSRSRSAAYIQVISTGPVSIEPLTGDPLSETGSQPDTGVAPSLISSGHVVLKGLDFASGAAELGEGPYPSLTQLAEFLADHPDSVLVLVGHTDSVGSLAQNTAVSKHRASAVRDYMLRTYDIAPDRIGAEGMGYLSPVASNLTPQGREANRRVEAVLLAGE